MIDISPLLLSLPGRNVISQRDCGSFCRRARAKGRKKRTHREKLANLDQTTVAKICSRQFFRRRIQLVIDF